MNYINKRAEKFVRIYIARDVSESAEVISGAKSELSNIDNNLDKATFLRIVLEANEKEYQAHLKVCKNKEDCSVNYKHETISYYLIQELNRLGIRTNNDQFTLEEKEKVESKLEEILAELQILTTGQEVIYDDLKAEIDKLRDLYILGKKTWFQLLLGKTSEMVLSGIISETVSKEIISAIEREFKIIRILGGHG